MTAVTHNTSKDPDYLNLYMNSILYVTTLSLCIYIYICIYILGVARYMFSYRTVRTSRFGA